MKLFDLHCDTSIRLLERNQSLYDNNCHISLKKAEGFENYAQVMAVFSQKHFSDSEAYSRFFEVVENLRKEVEKYKDSVKIIDRADEVLPLWQENKIPFILAVEDARILEGDISRLDRLWENGVKILTLNWSGETCIGGAHDTHSPLTDFGKEVVKKCFSLGIIPDVSHASFEGTKECIALAEEYKKPIIASHSDSYSVCQHSRNLTDEDFKKISSLGGIVGISLCPKHLANDGEASVSDIIKHIEHYLSLGGEDTVCLGCDLDGTYLPHGFEDLSDIDKIEKELIRLGYSDELIEKICYKNALDFIKNNI